MKAEFMKKPLAPKEKLERHYRIDKGNSPALDYQEKHDATNNPKLIKPVRAMRKRTTYQTK